MLDRCAVISDIHGNREALDAVLDDIPSGIPVLCLGDVVGYGPDPAYCIRKLKSLKIPTVLGNHDAALIGKLRISWFSEHARAALHWQREGLDPTDRAWLRDLPVTRNVDSALLVHGAPPDSFTTYLDGWIPAVARRALCEADARICAVGHTHIPFVALAPPPGTTAGRRDWRWELTFERSRTIELQKTQHFLFNPGSVGQPRDGIPQASYARLDLENRRLEMRRLRYDADRTRRRIHEAGLPPILGERLLHGA